MKIGVPVMTPTERGRAGAAAVLAKYGPEHYRRMGRLGREAAARVPRELRAHAGRSASCAPILRERLADGLAPCASVRAIAASYGFTRRQIVSPSRVPELVACRIEIAAFLFDKGLPITEIGRRLGRHWTTVGYLLKVWRRVTGEVL